MAIQFMGQQQAYHLTYVNGGVPRFKSRFAEEIRKALPLVAFTQTSEQRETMTDYPQKKTTAAVISNW